ncbi:MAG: GntR family transcriptional regulator [Granulosicoccus sp.]
MVADKEGTHLHLIAESGVAESITQRVYHTLRRDIVSGRLQPGVKLKVEQLRKEYGVGTSPLREALSLLTSDYLVERIDQRGFRVSQISQREYDDLLQTRCWLEERALRESIANGNNQWEEQLILANYRLSRIPRAATDKEPASNSDWEFAHKTFHETLISLCGSSILLKYCAQLYEQNVRYRQLCVSAAYPDRDVTEEHNNICDAVLARDADLAVHLLLSHYNNTSRFVRNELEFQNKPE